MKKAAILCGSDSDLEIMSECFKTLEKLEINFQIEILSAHRTPQETIDFIKKAEKEGFEVIIAAAGMSAHLPGICAAYTTLPVIGVPIKSSLEGLDALLSIVQMPPGVPVLTVGINAAQNAALACASILSLKYPEIKEKLKEIRDLNKEKVLSKNKKLKSQGWQNYKK